MVEISNSDATALTKAVANMDEKGLKGANARRVLKLIAKKICRKQKNN